ncbi:MAG: glycosyltransferase family 2 protein [Phycisphaerae bacterium]|nr:glycosyltransferase family 2 protein [Phycisphaerae bacterium]
MMLAVEILFWLSVGAALYTLAVYPTLTLVLAAVVRKEVDKKAIEPRVSFIIAAYNEEAAIAEKIKQTLELDYPRDRLEVIVASDGSTDRTDEIVESFADQGVRLFRGKGREGKTGMLNRAVATATGEIVIFSDATGVYSSQAIRELVANFHDARIGCVTGKVAYRYGEDSTSQAFKGYQRFAVAVRRAETRFGSQTSVSGSIHAIRRSLYQPANPAFSLDVVDAVHAVSQGYRVVYETEAVSVEESRTSMMDEFRCRVRIGVRATSSVLYIVGQLIGHRRFGYAFQMISHKIMRWWLWCFLLLALVTSIALAWDSPFYAAVAALQGLFYLTGLMGCLASRLKTSVPLVPTITLFVAANAAMACGAIKALAGKRMSAWEPVR